MRNNRRGNWSNILGWLFFALMMFSFFGGGGFSAVISLIVISIFVSVLFSIGGTVWRALNGIPNFTDTLQNVQREITARQPIRRPANYDDDDDDDLRPRVIPKEVAERAMRRAGNKSEDWLLSLEDIGVLAYHGDDSPDVVRMNPVAADTSHVRPFAVIRLPYKQGKGTIRFELFDELGTRRFTATEQYLLKQGANFITPRTYLPLPEDRTSGQWTLRISIGEKRLAEHAFMVRTPAAAAPPVRAILAEDGEIDPWLARAITEQGRQSGGLSLEELLASQPDERETDSRLR
ncbi:MAG: hypothetical protein DYG88_01780 [Chloroflexi bacterium CFX4]|nr:hypothetical protein [Chloroflexi bacterium CFX4]MDL1921371.1 hypothetical protein [Chloroflexi bacterium CFX3]